MRIKKIKYVTFLDKGFKIRKNKINTKLRKSSIQATLQLILTQNFCSNVSMPL